MFNLLILKLLGRRTRDVSVFDNDHDLRTLKLLQSFIKVQTISVLPKYLFI